MKRIFAVTAATFALAFAIGTGTAGAGELLDSQRITSAMEDQWQGHNYRNTMNLDKFVAALGDYYTPERYGVIMDSTRFAGVLAEKHSEEAATAAYTPKCGHRDIDYLASNIVLAKLIEDCE